VLQESRSERVFENIKRFVQIGAGMPGSHASTEANAIQWNGRIIHRRDPETTRAQFVTKPVHALALTDNNWHNISGRSSGIDAETAQLRMKIIGIVPKLFSQLRLLCSNLQCLDYRGHNHRWKGTGVDIGVSVEAQIL